MRYIFNKLDDVLNKTVLFGYDKVGYYARRPLWNETEIQTSLNGKTCLVTGANAGLGKATSLHLAQLGAAVYMLCRNEARGQAAVAEVIEKSGNQAVYLALVDMSSQQQIRQFAAQFQPESGCLDILVNNAGILPDKRAESVDGIEMTFAVNTLGYFLLTNLLRPLIVKAKQGRIINVSSGGMYTGKLHLDDLQYEKRPFNGPQVYAETKRAEVVLTQIWGRKLADTPVLVSAMHPGWADTTGVQTSLPRFHRLMRPLLRNPEQGADTIIWLAANPNLEKADSGQFWFDRKIRATHRTTRTRNSPQEIQQFWDICCTLTGYQEPYIV